MTNDLIVIEKENALTVFTTSNGLDHIIDRIRQEVSSLVPDTSTKKGRDAIASAAMKVARSKTYLDGVGKELVDKLKEQPKLIDAERKRVRDILDSLKDEIRKPLTEWEISEESRIQSIKSRIIAMQSQPEELTSKNIKLHISRLKKTDVTDGSFQEFGGEAALAKLSSIEKFEKLLVEVIVHENEQKELERLKKESEERAQREREEKLVKDAEERAKRQAEEKARIEIEKVQAAAVAEQQRLKDIQLKEENERIKRENEEIKRINDKNHREAIIKQACEDMVSYCGIGDDAANGLVDHILQGNIRNIIVKF